MTLSLAVFTPLCVAQSASSESNVVIDDRRWRIENLSFDLETDATAEQTLLRERAAFEHARAADRVACRDELRRSNKSTLMTVMLRCFSNDLNRTKGFALHQRSYAETISAVKAAVRQEALKKVDAFTDAIDTILFAIQSGVYETHEDLREAKSNLTAKYQQPMWHALLNARVDRSLTWIAHVLSYPDAPACIKAPEAKLRSSTTVPSGTFRTELGNLRLCLAESAQ